MQGARDCDPLFGAADCSFFDPDMFFPGQVLAAPSQMQCVGFIIDYIDADPVDFGQDPHEYFCVSANDLNPVNSFFRANPIC